MAIFDNTKSNNSKGLADRIAKTNEEKGYSKEALLESRKLRDSSTRKPYRNVEDNLPKLTRTFDDLIDEKLKVIEQEMKSKSAFSRAGVQVKGFEDTDAIERHKRDQAMRSAIRDMQQTPMPTELTIRPTLKEYQENAINSDSEISRINSRIDELMIDISTFTNKYKNFRKELRAEEKLEKSEYAKLDKQYNEKHDQYATYEKDGATIVFRIDNGEEYESDYHKSLVDIKNKYSAKRSSIQKAIRDQKIHDKPEMDSLLAKWNSLRKQLFERKAILRFTSSREWYDQLFQRQQEWKRNNTALAKISTMVYDTNQSLSNGLSYIPNKLSKLAVAVHQGTVATVTHLPVMRTLFADQNKYIDEQNEQLDQLGEERLNVSLTQIIKNRLGLTSRVDEESASIKESITELGNKLKSQIEDVKTNFNESLDKVETQLTDNDSNFQTILIILMKIGKYLLPLIGLVRNSFNFIVSYFNQFFDWTGTKFKSLWYSLLNAVNFITSGLFKGIAFIYDSIYEIKNKAIDIANSIIRGLNNIPGVNLNKIEPTAHEPSSFIDNIRSIANGEKLFVGNDNAGYQEWRNNPESWEKANYDASKYENERNEYKSGLNSLITELKANFGIGDTSKSTDRRQGNKKSGGKQFNRVNNSNNNSISNQSSSISSNISSIESNNAINNPSSSHPSSLTNYKIDKVTDNQSIKISANSSNTNSSSTSSESSTSIKNSNDTNSTKSNENNTSSINNKSLAESNTNVIVPNNPPVSIDMIPADINFIYHNANN